MMKRRDFGKALASGAVGTSVAAAQPGPPGPPKPNLLMHVGGDYHSVAGGPGASITGKANLEYNLRHGVRHLTAQVRKAGANGAWDADELKTMRDNCDKAGVILEAIRMDSEYIMLRPGPERDRRLDAIVGNIQKASAAGIRVITHHWTLIPIRRNGTRPGRGGTTYAAFDLEPNGRICPRARPARSRPTITGNVSRTFSRRSSPCAVSTM